MKKYFLFFISFIEIIFFIVITQQLAFAGQGLDQKCTGPGPGNCDTGYVCKIANPNQCTMTGAKDPAACQTTCQFVPDGNKCTSVSKCVQGDVCKQPDNLPTFCSSPQCAKNPSCLQSCSQKYCLSGQAQLGSPCKGSGKGNCSSSQLTCEGICKANKGGSCASSDLCKTGLTCQNGTCQNNSGGTPDCNEDGKSCNIGAQQGVPCSNSAYNCVPTTSNCSHTGTCTGTCQPKPGGACDKNNNSQAPQAPTLLPSPPLPPCKQWGSNGVCQTFGSTFGGFSTDPTGFIQKVFAILLSVSGGIALLLIIKAGYQLMTAQGNPEKLNNGREQLVAAIVGLVFLIFSFVFLQLIGFDILHIPGFNGSSSGASAQSCAASGLQFCSKIQQCYPAGSTCP